MKKVWKGAAAAIAALSLGVTGFVGASSAFAEENAPVASDVTTTKGSITISDETEGRTYNAYQIFSGSYDADLGTLGNVMWGNGISDAGKAALIAAVNEQITDTSKRLANNADAKDVAKAISDLNLTANSENAKKLANVFKTAANLGTQKTPLTWNAATKTYSADVDYGWYLVEDATDNSNKDDVNSSFIMKVVGAATATPKSVKPTVDKKVKDETTDAEADATDGWGNSADHAINETFQFKLTASLPASEDRADYDTYKVVFTDTMSTGVTFEKINSVKVNGTEINAGTADGTYATTATANQAGGSWTLTINDLKKVASLDITSAITIEVEYNAHLNEKAQVMNAKGDITNKNSVNLTYSNNPNAEGEGKTADKDVYVATFKMDNTKVNEDGDSLSGAEFNLKSGDTVIKFLRDDTDQYYYPSNDASASPTLTSDENGNFNIKGLDAGAYTLTETKTPAGYNTMADKTITIAATHLNQSVTNLTATGDLNLGADNPNQIINVKGSTLPSTGGMGTVVLYTVGGLIVLIAGVGLAIALRRRQA